MIRSYLEIHPDKKFILFPRPDETLWTSDFLCLVNAIIGQRVRHLISRSWVQILQKYLEGTGDVYDFGVLGDNVDAEMKIISIGSLITFLLQDFYLAGLNDCTYCYTKEYSTASLDI